MNPCIGYAKIKLDIRFPEIERSMRRKQEKPALPGDAVRTAEFAIL
jgi:hypothetical protein